MGMILAVRTIAVRVIAGLIEKLRAHGPLRVHLIFPRSLVVGYDGLRNNTGSIASAFTSGGCSGFSR